ncbi:hypothetical protein LTR27_011652 [Elasticomyces elasticus]|nr:hypothetical protein LTR27_011652 [Elasticomyces elasticus]
MTTDAQTTSPANNRKRVLSTSETGTSKRQKPSNQLLATLQHTDNVAHAIAALDKITLAQLLLEATRDSTTLRDAVLAKHKEARQKALDRVISFKKYVLQAAAIWQRVEEEGKPEDWVEKYRVVDELVAVIERIGELVEYDSSYGTRRNALQALCSIGERFVNVKGWAAREIQLEFVDHEVFREVMSNIIAMVRPRDMVLLRADDVFRKQVEALHAASEKREMGWRLQEILNVIEPSEVVNVFEDDEGAADLWSTRRMERWVHACDVAR